MKSNFSPSSRGEGGGSRMRAKWLSKTDLVAALEPKDLAGVVGACDLGAKPLDDLAHLGDLFGARFGEFALADPQRILEPDADVAAERDGLRGDRQLRPAGAEHRPVVVAAEQPVGGA